MFQNNAFQPNAFQDGPAGYFTHIVSVTESLTVTDTDSVIGAQNSIITETSTVADSFSCVQISTVIIREVTVNISDSIPASILSAVTESVTISDIFTASLITRTTLLDTSVTSSDTLITTWNTIGATIEITTTDDSQIVQYTSINSVIVEPITVTDSALPGVALTVIPLIGSIGTVFLSHYDTDFTDVAGHLVTSSGSPSISPAFSKFGGAALAINSTSTYVVSSSVDFDFTQDHQVDFWFYIAYTNGLGYLFRTGNDVGTYGTGGWQIFFSGTTFYIFSTNAAGSLVVASVFSNTFPTVGWHHIAVSFKGSTSTITGWLDGVQTFTSATNNAGYTNQRIKIGLGVTAGTVIDEVRVIIGTANLTYVRGTNFTPPTAPYTDYISLPSAISTAVLFNQPFFISTVSATATMAAVDLRASIKFDPPLATSESSGTGSLTTQLIFSANAIAKSNIFADIKFNTDTNFWTTQFDNGPASESTGTGNLTTAILLTCSVNGNSTVASFLTTVKVLESSISAVATSTSDLTTSKKLASSAFASSTSFQVAKSLLPAIVTQYAYVQGANGQFFAPIQEGTGRTYDLAVSSDGISWTTYSTGVFNFAYAVTSRPRYLNSLYLVDAYSSFAYSSNGTTWTYSTGYPAYFVTANMVYVAGLYILFGNVAGSTYYTSPTAATWTARTSLPASSAGVVSATDGTTLYTKFCHVDNILLVNRRTNMGHRNNICPRQCYLVKIYKRKIYWLFDLYSWVLFDY